MICDLEMKLQQLGIVNLRISERHGEYVVVARGPGGRTVVARGRSPGSVVGRVLSVLELEVNETVEPKGKLPCRKPVETH